MKSSVVALHIAVSLLLVSWSALAQAKEHIVDVTVNKTLPVSMCLTKDDGIYILPAGSKVAERWLSAENVSDVRLSPGGDSIAYTAYFKSVDSKLLRQIAILDSKKSKPRIIFAPTKENCYGPIWSPDGKLLAFNYWHNGAWAIATVAKDGTGFKVIKAGRSGKDSTKVAFWASDSKSMYSYGFDAIYHSSLDGNDLDRIRFDDMPLKPTTTGGRMELSPDGSRLLIETQIDEAGLAFQCDPPPVLFLYGIETKKIERLSPSGSLMTNPSWLPDGKSFVFSQDTKTSSDVYRMEITTKQVDRIVSGGREPSLSR